MSVYIKIYYFKTAKNSLIVKIICKTTKTLNAYQEKDGFKPTTSFSLESRRTK